MTFPVRSGTTGTRRTEPPYSHALRAGRLGRSGLVAFGMTAGTPLTVVAGVVTTGFAATGITGLPAAFILIGATLWVFSIGYTAMARYITNAGSFYAYIAQGASRRLGVGAAWLALISYNLLQVGLYGAIGAATKPVLQQYLHANPPWWVIALAAWALTAVMGILKVDVNSRLLVWLLVAEVVVIIVYSVANIVDPATGSLSLATLSPRSLFVHGSGALLALAVLGFIGFESPVVFTEEARDSYSTVPAATKACIGITAVLYTFGSWAMTMGSGPARIVADSRDYGPDLLFNLAGSRLGQGAAEVGHLLLVGSIVAASISFHGTTARYGFALGREQVLPTWLGRISNRTGAPIMASMAQSGIGFIVIVSYAAFGWDPLVQLFYWGGTIGGIGVLALLTMTSGAVIGFFAGHSYPEARWTTIGAPALAFAALFVALFLALRNGATLLGVPPGHPLTWIVPVGLIATITFGAVWGNILRVRHPDVYAGIGQGATSAAVRRANAAVARAVR